MGSVDSNVTTLRSPNHGYVFRWDASIQQFLDLACDLFSIFQTIGIYRTRFADNGETVTFELIQDRTIFVLSKIRAYSRDPLVFNYLSM